MTMRPYTIHIDTLSDDTCVVHPAPPMKRGDA